MAQCTTVSVLSVRGSEHLGAQLSTNNKGDCHIRDQAFSRLPSSRPGINRRAAGAQRVRRRTSPAQL